MEKLKKIIVERGEIKEGNVLKVDSFLNHQLDVEFLNEIGEEIYNLFKSKNITKILTIEVSGIAIATMSALYFKVPVVFAKKSESLNLDKDVYKGKVISYTKNKEYNIMISKKYINENDKLLIIDDFLAEGNAMKALIELAEQAGASVEGIGIVIEKGFQNGGNYLRSMGYNLKCLTTIEEMKDGKITFK
ncbi:xanthine phosphoribosyltransferase [Sedimentibacter sp.]|uniref:xanthine phosphoribosyltransferase n=1 Tax=Sedimentibacter sp. TaxID=1960295 RepID=UPI0028A7CD0E|nr:xanthine phosphoribosyltransferase [Sedimentibacter sp.]